MSQILDNLPAEDNTQAGLEPQDVANHKAFLLGLPGSAWAAHPDDYHYLVTLAGLYRGTGVTPWDLAQVWRKLAGREEVVPLQVALTTISGALATCWLGTDVGDMGLGTPPRPEGLYAICANLIGPKDPTPADDATKEKEPTRSPWSDLPSEALPEALVAATETSPLLQEQQRRRKVLSAYPHFR